MVLHPMVMDYVTQQLDVEVQKQLGKHWAQEHPTKQEPQAKPLASYQSQLGPASEKGGEQHKTVPPTPTQKNFSLFLNF